MATPPRDNDESTSPGQPPVGLDAALGFDPIEDDDPEGADVSVAEVRQGPGSGLRPPTGETRRPTDRRLAPPPIPRPTPPPPEVEPIAPPVSTVTKPGMPAFDPVDHEDAPPHVRSALLRRRVSPEAARTLSPSPRMTPPPPPPSPGGAPASITRPPPRPLIRPAHEPAGSPAPQAPTASSALLETTVIRASAVGSVADPLPREPEPAPYDLDPGDAVAPLPWHEHPTSETVEAEQAPWRREADDSDPAFHLPGRLLADQAPERTRTATTARPRPTTAPRLLARAGLAALALLLVAAALPSGAGPPWELALRPADPTFVALVACALVGIVAFVPLGPRGKAAATIASGALVLALGLALLGDEVAAAFDGQPALLALFAGSPAIGAALVLAATLVPAGLFLRALAPRHLAATGLVGFGAALVLAVAFGVGGIFDAPPVVLLVDGITDAPFLGDRVAAAATLPALALLTGCLAFTFPGLGRSIAAPIGVLVWLLAFAPALVLAAFVAPADQWLAVLGPVKLVLLVAAATLQLSAGLAAVMLPRSPPAGHLGAAAPASPITRT